MSNIGRATANENIIGMTDLGGHRNIVITEVPKKEKSFWGKAMDLGKKAVGGVSNLGHKVIDAGAEFGKWSGNKAREGYNWTTDHTEDIRKVSDQVADIAGKVATGAGMAGAAIASTGVGLPLAGLVEGVGLAAGAVGAGAKGVSKGTKMIDEAKKKGILKHAKKGGGFGFVDLDKL
tara:strand:- start:1826 stop:2356 length:531 start_codon:yes stop_codon:yes gene_type:complete